MEYTEMDELFNQLEQLMEAIRLQLAELDQTLHSEIETLQLQINNLRN
jgi:hypothetical protein